MNKIAWLEQQIEKASALVPQGSLVAEPSTPFAGLAAESMRAHLAELQHDLYLAKAERAKELVTLRLIGPRLNAGAIPLVLLSRLSDRFSRAMEAISYKLQHGIDEKRSSGELQSILDLRLADVVAGSTQLVITGNVTPDLVGDSLLESSLKATFQLLHSDAAGLAASALSVGPKASQQVGKLLTELEAEKCSVELAWTDPSDVEHRWTASPYRVAELRYRLAQLAEVPPEVLMVFAEVELLSASGRITLRTSEGDKIAAKYPRELYPAVQELHLGQKSEFKVLLNRMHNPNTEQDVQSYTLLSVGRALPRVE
ncbi:MAG: hypothetical protein K0M70_02980 [Arenimonas sp.]|uniref:hypothetical protein n=1 Tax=Arenimonas sp. TaxID=1872635 RepID=UPI0025C0F21A|nr:hypothetical protein [Arenimonas sp.]MBW8366806.1 hypothetical protein [Arenimonas sp.]